MAFQFATVAYAASNSKDNFDANKTYVDEMFLDVSADAWYADSVKTAYQAGLMSGKSETIFDPLGYITLAETITIAARMHSIYSTGEDNFGQSDIRWYAPYVEYTIDNYILTDFIFDYDATATRAEFVKIIANALPASELSAIKSVEDGDIPDVSLSDDYGKAVYKLYQAGILNGSDEQGTFNPDNNITRAEVAAIICRMVVQ